MAGAAVVIEERELSSALGHALEGLLANPERLVQMGKAARVLARPDAAARIADKVEALALRPGTGPGGHAR